VCCGHRVHLKGSIMADKKAKRRRQRRPSQITVTLRWRGEGDGFGKTVEFETWLFPEEAFRRFANAFALAPGAKLETAELIAMQNGEGPLP